MWKWLKKVFTRRKSIKAEEEPTTNRIVDNEEDEELKELLLLQDPICGKHHG